jgi:hypothetical protein
MPITALMIFLFVLICVLLASLSCETPVLFFVTFCLIAFLGSFIYLERPKTIDLSKDKFYKISIIKFEDGTTKQISIISDGTIKHISSFSDKIYHEDSILREYKYNSKEHWIDYDGYCSRHYEVLIPEDEGYEEAKEKLVAIDIVQNW